MSTIVYVAVPLFLLLMGVEIWRAARVRGRIRGYEWRDSLASLSMGVGNVIISLGTKVVTLALYTALYQFRLFDIGYVWWAWPLAILGDDFCYYWFHRASHEVRFLWAAHENHHSSRHYNLSTALRQSWTTPFTGPLFWAPLALLGVEPLMILTAQGISLVYQFWIHTELIDRLGPFEAIFNTPSHHRVHHGRNVRYLDRNHGGILIVWDRLFGTFEPESEPVDFGLTKNIHTFNPLRIATHEWIAMFRDARRAESLGDAVRTLLKPPGWSADGSTLTATQLQRQPAA
ncbi:MAG: sterol desaturase family protein [Myxococcota bacterium]|nr:sterol desaturase family protein [Myxococcota bacterium]